MTPHEVVARAESDFGKRMQKVLSPSQTIQHPELLRGRQAQLDDIRKAFFSPGRQVFIYGFRGVGKSSLARTAAFQQQAAKRDPIFVQCTAKAGCFELVREIVAEALPSDPRVIKKTFEASAKAGTSSLGMSARVQIEQGSVPLPTSINDCLRILELVCLWHSERPVIVVDEFDQISSPDEQLQFANLVKAIADRHVPIAFIFCGIGSSLDDLFSAHASAHRYFHSVSLDRLPWDPRLEIVDAAAAELGIFVEDTTRYRIATVSDGFPHYVHLVCEKLFWLVYEAGADFRATPDHFEKALEAAVAAMEPELKKPYETATRKYSNDCEPILWAAADGDEFQRRSRDIYTSYQRIMEDLGEQPLDRTVFNARMNSLKQSSHGSVLLGTRQGWYEFREKVLRGYARLRALQRTVRLEREHPLQRRRYNTIITDA